MASICQVVHAYNARGLKVTSILENGGFECTRSELAEMGITLNAA